MYKRPIIKSPIVDFENGGLRSKDFDDWYCSQYNGLDEAEHVFLSGSSLPGRWSGVDRFTIGELGFGRGRNFFVIASAWAKHRPSAHARLIYTAIEGYPLPLATFLKSIDPCFKESIWSSVFQQSYPPQMGGVHRLFFPFGIELSLWFMDVHEALAGPFGPIDAWFMDGFSPHKNPKMWDMQTIEGIAQNSNPAHATIATYSSAAEVGRCLSRVGFSLQRIKGWGPKRHMLIGDRKGENRGLQRERPLEKRPLSPFLPSLHSRPSHVAIIGGGIAGILMGYALSRRNVRTSIFDRCNELVPAASGIPLAVVGPDLSIDPWPGSVLRCLGTDLLWRLARHMAYHTEHQSDNQIDRNRVYQSLPSWANNCGTWHLADSLKQKMHIQKMISRLRYPSDFYSYREDVQGHGCPGIYFGSGGVIGTHGFASELMSHAVHASFFPKTAVRRICQSETGQGWIIYDDYGNVICEDISDIIIASGGWYACVGLLGGIQGIGKTCLSPLGLHSLHGRLLSFQESSPWDYVLNNGNGYLAPGIGTMVYGATYHRNSFSTENDGEIDMHRLLSGLNKLGINPHNPPSLVYASRWGSIDRLPVIGSLSNNKDRADLNGLWILSGFGSRGFSYGFLGAELLADMMCGESLCVDRTLLQHISSFRFL